MATPNYRLAAFFNLRNFAFLFAGTTAWAFTGAHRWVGLAFLGAELLWLAVAPNVRPFRAAQDRKAADRAVLQSRREVQRQASGLPQADWARAQGLEDLRRELEKVMAQNPTFTRIVLEPELQKLDELHAAFVSLAVAASRAEAHVASPEAKGLESQLDEARRAVDVAADETAKELATQNVAVLERRVQRLADARTFSTRARAQMALIENSVRLLKDQALTLTDPAEVRGQLDDLLHGVDALQKVVEVDEGLRGPASSARVRT